MGDIVERLKETAIMLPRSGYVSVGHEAKEAIDEITALRARLAEVEEERALDRQAWKMTFQRADEAEVKVARLTAQLDQEQAFTRLARGRAEAAEAQVTDLTAMLATARRDALEEARPTDREVSDLAYRMWSVHPREIAEQGYEHVSIGGKYENPRCAWYADQIKSVFNAAAIRALKDTLPQPTDIGD